MQPIKMKLYNNQELLEHCQVTYTSRNAKGEKLIYCLQYQGQNSSVKVKLLRCSQDGEPSHEVTFTKIAQFERPTGDSNTEVAVRDWINAYERNVQS